MKDINKRKRKDYNKKAYQKRKAKKTEEKEKPKTEEKEKPKKAEEKQLMKKSFILNKKKFTFMDTPAKKNKAHSALMASDKLLIRKIYYSYKEVKELYEGDNPPALASPALALLCDYLEEATEAHKKGVPWAINNYKEINKHIEEIKEFLFNS